MGLSMTTARQAFVTAANDLAILTPYLVPREMRRKRVNLGDGFIFHAIERHIGKFPADHVFSPRLPPSPAVVEKLRAARGVVLGGANQLSDDFAPWPGLTADEIRRLKLRFIPFGIGLDGLKKKNRGFNIPTREIIQEIHEHIEYSSWRCPRTVALLEAAFPDLKDKFLMTGCPVSYDRPLLEGRHFAKNAERVAVTVTERDDFLEREIRTLEDVARQFPTAEKFLVLHQDFRKLRKGIGPAVRKTLPPSWLGDIAILHARARRLGFRLVSPGTAEECIRFYGSIGLHVGSRLHAHLLFLSQNKWSFLTYVDDRSLGFSEYLGFPMLEPGQLAHHLDFDFENVRGNAQKTWPVMERFLESLAQG